MTGKEYVKVTDNIKMEKKPYEDLVYSMVDFWKIFTKDETIKNLDLLEEEDMVAFCIILTNVIVQSFKLQSEDFSKDDETELNEIIFTCILNAAMAE
jgi:hypothetical protein